MKKKLKWLKSLVICLVLFSIMFFCTMHMLYPGEQGFLPGNIVEAARFEQKDIKDFNANIDRNMVEEKQFDSVVSNVVTSQSSDYKGQQETKTEEPSVYPVLVEHSEEVVIAVQSGDSAYPVSYSWGNANSYTFRVEVTVTNNGSETAKDVMVSVPLLENDSPYQETTLKIVNYEMVSVSGRVSTFNLGSIEPGQSKNLIADFAITVKPLSVNNTNETIENARMAYEQFAGSGNCRELAQGFITMCEGMGIKAREVVGFARPSHGPMTSGSLAGCRHSWAEFFVEGLGWVPVDLTFQYFAEFPYPSHIVECYEDQSIRITHRGGTLSAMWLNIVI